MEEDNYEVGIVGGWKKGEDELKGIEEGRGGGETEMKREER
jgi:hypothetical protein